MASIDPLGYVSLVLVVTVLVLVIVVRRYNDKVSDLKEEVARLSSAKQSLSTTYGRITEQWAPFMGDYPHDPQNFRFLGSPIDGVQFEDDRIVFVEFKTNNSRLTPRQQKMRRLVEEGRVEWLEFRMGEKTSPSMPSAPKFNDTSARVEDL